MATVGGERHAGGRPRTREPSELFLKVERLARQRGMHLDELASKAGVSTPTLYQLRDPRVSTAKAIAEALGITLDRLISPPRRSSRRSSA